MDDQTQPIDLQADQKEPLKAPVLEPEQCRKWLNRFKTANKNHRKAIWPKYRQAKKRYNSEIGYAGIAANLNTAKIKHNDINLIKKTANDFIGSIFFRNPEINLEPQNDKDENEARNVSNLSQSVNDDIKDRDQEIKSKLRSTLLDEYLGSMGAIYIDYDYRDKETDQPVMAPQQVPDESGAMTMQHAPVIDPTTQQPIMQREIVRQKIRFEKILIENLFYPNDIHFYDYKEGTFLGFVDIVTLESLKNDQSLDQALVGKITGKEYKALLDVELRDKNADKKTDDGVLHARIYRGFIKGDDNLPLKQLVICDDPDTESTPLCYEDFDKGHGHDDRGYPIHILQLNDACDGFIPPSEAFVHEPLLQMIDYIYEKINKHVRRSSTKTFIRVGAGGLEKGDLDKLVRNNNQEYIGVDKLTQGTPLESIIKQIVDQPLSVDHQQIFEIAKQMYDQISRQPAFSKAEVLNKKKTATESEAIQSTDNTQNGDYVDKFSDFLKGIFFDWAKLKQRNFQGTMDLSVKNNITGGNDPRPDLTKDNLQGDFHANIEISSFLPEDKALRRQQVKEIIQDATVFLNPLLAPQGLRLNPHKLTEKYLENADIRDSADLFIPVVMRPIDQQLNEFAFKNIPMNPNHLGGDYQKSLQRLQQIFGDDQLMAPYEAAKPGIGTAQNSPLIQYMQMLVQMSQQEQQPGAAPPKAGGDVPRGAGMMAGAQR